MKTGASPKRRRLIASGLIVVAVAWEAYWLYEYVAAPRPDRAMRSVAASLFGGVLPIALIGSITIVAILGRLLRRDRS